MNFKDGGVERGEDGENGCGRGWGGWKRARTGATKGEEEGNCGRREQIGGGGGTEEGYWK